MSLINKKAQIKALDRLLSFANEDCNKNSDFIRDRADFKEISDTDLAIAMKWLRDKLRAEKVKIERVLNKEEPC